MKRFFIQALLTLFSVIAIAPVFSAETTEDFHPIRNGMRLKFVSIIEHTVQKEKIRELTVVKNSFPESLTYSWVLTEPNEKDSSGTRILTDLKYSRNFNPWFKTDESKATSDTAPWLSQDVLKELRENGTALNFREGGAGAINWVATSLEVKEKVIFPVIINGKPEALHALRLNKGITVWNNMNNPLVLQYEPLGIPLFTSITGWKLVEINY